MTTTRIVLIATLLASSVAIAQEPIGGISGPIGGISGVEVDGTAVLRP